MRFGLFYLIGLLSNAKTEVSCVDVAVTVETAVERSAVIYIDIWDSARSLVVRQQIYVVDVTSSNFI